MDGFVAIPNRRSRQPWAGPTSVHPQQRVIAHRQHQPSCKVGRGPTTKRQTEVVDDAVGPCRASRRGSHNTVREAFGADLPPAQDGIATEAASDNAERYAPTGSHGAGNGYAHAGKPLRMR